MFISTITHYLSSNQLFQQLVLQSQHKEMENQNFDMQSQ